MFAGLLAAIPQTAQARLENFANSGYPTTNVEVAEPNPPNTVLRLPQGILPGAIFTPVLRFDFQQANEGDGPVDSITELLSVTILFRNTRAKDIASVALAVEVSGTRDDVRDGLGGLSPSNSDALGKRAGDVNVPGAAGPGIYSPDEDTIFAYAPMAQLLTDPLHPLDPYATEFYVTFNLGQEPQDPGVQPVQPFFATQLDGLSTSPLIVASTGDTYNLQDYGSGNTTPTNFLLTATAPNTPLNNLVFYALVEPSRSLRHKGQIEVTFPAILTSPTLFPFEDFPFVPASSAHEFLVFGAFPDLEGILFNVPFLLLRTPRADCETEDFLIETGPGIVAPEVIEVVCTPNFGVLSATEDDVLFPGATFFDEWSVEICPPPEEAEDPEQTTTTVIAAGQCVTGALAEGDDQDDRSFFDDYTLVWLGGNLEITLSSMEINPSLTISTPDGEVLVPFPPTVFSLVDAATGVYTIRVTAGPDQTGLYLLCVEDPLPCISFEDEVEEIFFTATAIPIAPATEVFNIKLQVQDPDDDDPDDGLDFFTADFFLDLPEVIALEVPSETTTFNIRVTSRLPMETGSYTISVCDSGDPPPSPCFVTDPYFDNYTADELFPTHDFPFRPRVVCTDLCGDQVPLRKLNSFNTGVTDAAEVSVPNNALPRHTQPRDSRAWSEFPSTAQSAFNEIWSQWPPGYPMLSLADRDPDNASDYIVLPGRVHPDSAILHGPLSSPEVYSAGIPYSILAIDMAGGWPGGYSPRIDKMSVEIQGLGTLRELPADGADNDGDGLTDEAGIEDTPQDHQLPGRNDDFDFYFDLLSYEPRGGQDRGDGTRVGFFQDPAPHGTPTSTTEAAILFSEGRTFDANTVNGQPMTEAEKRLVVRINELYGEGRRPGQPIPGLGGFFQAGQQAVDIRVNHGLHEGAFNKGWDPTFSVEHVFDELDRRAILNLTPKHYRDLVTPGYDPNRGGDGLTKAYQPELRILLDRIPQPRRSYIVSLLRIGALQSRLIDEDGDGEENSPELDGFKLGDFIDNNPPSVLLGLAGLVDEGIDEEAENLFDDDLDGLVDEDVNYVPLFLAIDEEVHNFFIDGAVGPSGSFDPDTDFFYIDYNNNGIYEDGRVDHITPNRDEFVSGPPGEINPLSFGASYYTGFIFPVDDDLDAEGEDGNPLTPPPATFDGVDNDGDGLTDEGWNEDVRDVVFGELGNGRLPFGYVNGGYLFADTNDNSIFDGLTVPVTTNVDPDPAFPCTPGNYMGTYDAGGANEIQVTIAGTSVTSLSIDAFFICQFPLGLTLVGPTLGIPVPGTEGIDETGNFQVTFQLTDQFNFTLTGSCLAAGLIGGTWSADPANIDQGGQPVSCGLGNWSASMDPSTAPTEDVPVTPFRPTLDTITPPITLTLLGDDPDHYLVNFDFGDPDQFDDTFHGIPGPEIPNHFDGNYDLFLALVMSPNMPMGIDFQATMNGSAIKFAHDYRTADTPNPGQEGEFGGPDGDAILFSRRDFVFPHVRGFLEPEVFQERINTFFDITSFALPPRFPAIAQMGAATATIFEPARSNAYQICKRMFSGLEMADMMGFTSPLEKDGGFRGRPYLEASCKPTAILGINVVDTPITSLTAADTRIESIRVNFQNVDLDGDGAFDPTIDFKPLTNIISIDPDSGALASQSGVALYRDNKNVELGSVPGEFDPTDIPIEMAIDSLAWHEMESGEGAYYLVLRPDSGPLSIPGTDFFEVPVDGLGTQFNLFDTNRGYDYFIVVRTSDAIDARDTFQAFIRSGDIRFNNGFNVAGTFCMTHPYTTNVPTVLDDKVGSVVDLAPQTDQIEVVPGGDSTPVIGIDVHDSNNTFDGTSPARLSAVSVAIEDINVPGDDDDDDAETDLTLLCLGSDLIFLDLTATGTGDPAITQVVLGVDADGSAVSCGGVLMNNLTCSGIPISGPASSVQSVPIVNSNFTDFIFRPEQNVNVTIVLSGDLLTNTTINGNWEVFCNGQSAFSGRYSAVSATPTLKANGFVRGGSFPGLAKQADSALSTFLRPLTSEILMNIPLDPWEDNDNNPDTLPVPDGIDNDRDGLTDEVGEDDDNDPRTFPIPDGLDNDGDGLTDEGFRIIDGVTYENSFEFDPMRYTSLSGIALFRDMPDSDTNGGFDDPLDPNVINPDLPVFLSGEENYHFPLGSIAYVTLALDHDPVGPVTPLSDGKGDPVDPEVFETIPADNIFRNAGNDYFVVIRTSRFFQVNRPFQVRMGVLMGAVNPEFPTDNFAVFGTPLNFMPGTTTGIGTIFPQRQPYDFDPLRNFVGVPSQSSFAEEPLSPGAISVPGGPAPLVSVETPFTLNESYKSIVSKPVVAVEDGNSPPQLRFLSPTTFPETQNTEEGLVALTAEIHWNDLDQDTPDALVTLVYFPVYIDPITGVEAIPRTPLDRRPDGGSFGFQVIEGFVGRLNTNEDISGRDVETYENRLLSFDNELVDPITGLGNDVFTWDVRRVNFGSYRVAAILSDRDNPRIIVVGGIVDVFNERPVVVLTRPTGEDDGTGK